MCFQIFCSGTQCFLGMSEEAVSYLYFLISCLRDLKMHAQTHSATEIEKKGLFVKKKKKKREAQIENCLLLCIPKCLFHNFRTEAYFNRA